jgi:hypothetical protein
MSSKLEQTARVRLARPAGPPTERHSDEAPKIQRLSMSRLATLAAEQAGKQLTPGPAAVMSLDARKPYDAARGNIDVYMPGRWDTTSNLIFMMAIRQVGKSVGEWEGSAAYIEFKPPANGTYLIVGHFTGYQTTMHLNGPWGDNTAYTAETSDAGAVVAVWTGSQQFSFTMHCKAPNNDYGLGYIESIQVYALT